VDALVAAGIEEVEGAADVDGEVESLGFDTTFLN